MAKAKSTQNAELEKRTRMDFVDWEAIEGDGGNRRGAEWQLAAS